MNRWYADLVKRATASAAGGRVVDGQVLDADGAVLAVDTKIHSLRHLAGSAMYAYGERAGADMLGHSSSTITREFYLHSLAEQHVTEMNAVATLLDPEAAGGTGGGTAPS